MLEAAHRAVQGASRPAHISPKEARSRGQLRLQKAGTQLGAAADLGVAADISSAQMTICTACRYTALTITSARS